jgi:hypothetical protein
MKKIISFLFIIICIYSCDVVSSITKSSGSSSSTTILSQAEVAYGLKEALKVGIKNTVQSVSKTNGFYSNSLIKIPFPEEAAKVKELCEKAGLKTKITQFEEKLNRAAEDASKEATEIFVTAITQMTISDAITILKGNDDAATQYLKKSTSQKLYTKFYPVVKTSTEKVMLAKYWTPLADKYNTAVKITGGKEITTDLNAYITNKALDGIFTIVAKEEKQIRTNASARVNDILKKVFGSSLNPYNK